METATRWFVLPLLVAACSIGPSGRSYAPAKGPAGAAVEIELHRNGGIGGELLAVEDTTLLLVENRHLIRVAIPAVKSLRGPRISTRQLDEPMRQRLRLISRYPQGVSPDLEARLLHAYGAPLVRSVP